MSDTVLRDLRIGLRVLVKEKGFCALATIVLALGICGVTTMFSVVNGVMLRGFSFPNADRLASANFIDPTTQTAFGVNGQITSMDFMELLPVQKSFEMMSAYLNGSTVNITINGQPHRYTGAYTTENFLKILGVAPMKGRDFEAADNQPGAEKVALIGYGIWQRDFGGAEDTIGRVVRINGRPATIIGIMPRGFAFPTNEEVWIPLYGEFPPRPRNDPAALSPGGARAAEKGRLRRSSDARVHGPCAPVRGDLSGHQQAVQHRPGPAADRKLHAAAAPRHAADDARLLRRRAADRLRQRHEHAVRPRDASRPRTRDQIFARRQPRPSRPADVDRESAALEHRRRARHRARVRRDGLAHGDHPQPRQSAAVLDHVRPLPVRARGHGAGDDRRGGRVGLVPRHRLVAEPQRRGASRQRPRQHELSRQPAVTQSRRFPDRHHVRAVDRRDAAAPVDRPPAEHRLRLRHGRHHVGPHGADGRRLSIV